jgi:hypothetical protein
MEAVSKQRGDSERNPELEGVGREDERPETDPRQPVKPGRYPKFGSNVV